MKEKLNQIREEALSAIAADNADVEQIRIKYLGKKGELTSVLRGMGALSSEERPIVGQLANEVRAEVEAALAEKVQALKEQALEKQLKDEKIDVTLPSSPLAMGHLHPLTQMQRRIEEIFIGMGFSIAEGPEVEFDYYNFQALNIPENHPARDTQDTFYITENILLRAAITAAEPEPLAVFVAPRGRDDGQHSEALADETVFVSFHSLQGYPPKRRTPQAHGRDT